MDTQGFLLTLFGDVPDGYIELAFLGKERDLFPHTVTSYLSLPRAAIDTAAILRGNERGYNAFFGTTVKRRRYEPERKVSKRGRSYTIYPHRSNENDAKWLTALWVDIDNVTDLQAYDRLDKLIHQPSLVIASGGGIHAYWLLDQPLDLDQYPRSDIKRTIEGLGVAVGGDKVNDLARIMRIPGTKNTKLKYGNDQPLCTVLIDDSHLRYSFADLEIAYKPLGTPDAPRIRRHIPQEATQGLPSWVYRMPVEGERNHHLYSAAIEYAARGLSENQAFNEIAAPMICNSFTRDEAAKTIMSAFQRQRRENIRPQLPAHMSAVMGIEDNRRTG